MTMGKMELLIVALLTCGACVDAGSGTHAGEGVSTADVSGDTPVGEAFADVPSGFVSIEVTIEGEGEVVLDPPGPFYVPNTWVSLTAMPAAGWRFASWGGDLSGSTDQAWTLVSTNMSVIARFEKTSETVGLTVTRVGHGVVILDPPGGTYDTGTVVKALAVPSPGWRFDGWSGDIQGPSNPATLVMDASRSIAATFVTASLADRTVYTNSGTAPSGAGPTGPSTFTLEQTTFVSAISTRHVGAVSEPAGTILLTGSGGFELGPIPATWETQAGNIPGMWRTAKVGAVLGPGTYAVEDSSPTTWGVDSASGQGMIFVEGSRPQKLGEATIGPQGGTLSGGGLSIEFPPGVWATSLSLSVLGLAPDIPESGQGGPPLDPLEPKTPRAASLLYVLEGMPAHGTGDLLIRGNLLYPGETDVVMRVMHRAKPDGGPAFLTGRPWRAVPGGPTAGVVLPYDGLVKTSTSKPAGGRVPTFPRSPTPSQCENCPVALWFEDREMTLVTSPYHRFEIHFLGQHAVLADTLGKMLESAYVTLEESGLSFGINPSLGQRLHVNLWDFGSGLSPFTPWGPSPSWWGCYTPSLVAGLFGSRSWDTLDFNTRRMNEPTAHDDLRNTVIHELCHMLQARYIDPLDTSKTWLNDAMCVWWEFQENSPGYRPDSVTDEMVSKMPLHGLFRPDDSAIGNARDHGYSLGVFLAHTIHSTKQIATLTKNWASMEATEAYRKSFLYENPLWDSTLPAFLYGWYSSQYSFSEGPVQLMLHAHDVSGESPRVLEQGSLNDPITISYEVDLAPLAAWPFLMDATRLPQIPYRVELSLGNVLNVWSFLGNASPTDMEEVMLYSYYFPRSDPLRKHLALILANPRDGDHDATTVVATLKLKPVHTSIVNWTLTTPQGIPYWLPNESLPPYICQITSVQSNGFTCSVSLPPPSTFVFNGTGKFDPPEFRFEATWSQDDSNVPCAAGQCDIVQSGDLLIQAPWPPLECSSSQFPCSVNPVTNEGHYEIRAIYNVQIGDNWATLDTFENAGPVLGSLQFY